jgi:hypothetical protein
MPTWRSTVPLFWNIVLDGLLRRLFNAHYQAQSYADDMVSQGALNCVENWCREIGLSVNASREQWSCSRITERLEAL